jgi:hypothetical protein
MAVQRVSRPKRELAVGRRSGAVAGVFDPAVTWAFLAL